MINQNSKRTWRYKVRPITIDGDVAYIPLTQGRVAIIDRADVSLVEGWNWCALREDRYNKTWYAGRAVNRRYLRLHQFLEPPPPGMEIDHIDRNGLNNRRANLRFVTRRQNTQNRKRVNVTGFKGVSRSSSCHSRWQAEICINGKRQFLGNWGNPVEAAKAYDRAAREHFGAFACLNFPDEAS
jgi:hypothetical protein